MKSNYFADFNVVNDTLTNLSKSLGSKSISYVQRDTIKESISDDSINGKHEYIGSESTVGDSMFTINNAIFNTDTLHQVEVKQEPRFGGNAISRFQNIGFGNDWFVGVILFSLFLLASVRFLFGKYLSKLVESIFNFHTANNLFLERNINIIKASSTINVLFVVNISLFVINVMNHNSRIFNQQYGFKEFIFLLVGVCCLYIGKVIVIRSLGYIFKGDNESKEYLFTTFLYNKNIGLFLFPVIIAMPFVQSFAVVWLMYIGGFMISFFYVLRLLRGLKILFRKHVSIFYMILYLCALEIFPLLMIYKLLVG
ncbi:DUF4271 domain-containing protein [Ancylomarina sp. 16SWW S1-10-2]|uniref:DUF4271 domain-containing protein n=1 Tax=Ancylomarina sp. 16SWW S1-10-2 TaxID=2499681 RepID=UPI0012AD4144|nr:DUF4271 domain-containing protein [Ancylomarina sp. 16SWW S1-10-2]MRT92115.1 DUF4271 domain-containing protein [Ancylomarina sp. 16SWW S1-10-2]